MAEIIFGLDIGTTKVCALVGEIRDQQLQIIGLGIVPAGGMHKGMVVDVGEASRAMAAAIEQAEQTSGYDLSQAIVSMAGEHISCTNNKGLVAINRNENGVARQDIEHALEVAQAIPIPHNRQIVHLIPRAYTIDNQEGVRNPIGMHGYRLEVEAHIVTGSTSSVRNLIKCVQSSGIHIDALVLEPLASGEAVLTDIEREMGVVLVDIGGGTTDIAIFIEGSIWHTVVLPTGGEQITNDIAVGLRTPYNVAEEIKLKYGHALPDGVIPEEMIRAEMFGQDGHQQLPRQFLAEIVEARTEEIFEMVLNEIKRSGYDGLLPAGVVLCGGTANLPGIRDLAREVMGLPTRIGEPQDLRGLVETLHNPAYAASIGLLDWGIQHDLPAQPAPQPPKNGMKMPTWLKAFLPG